VSITKAAIQRGRRFEPKWVAWLRDRGRDAEKIPNSGTNDESDVIVRTDGVFLIQELKSPGGLSNVDLLAYFKQAELEAQNWAKRRGRAIEGVVPMVVVEDHKSRKGPGHAIVCVRAEQFFPTVPDRPSA
jgi:hypothetical protein